MEPKQTSVMYSFYTQRCMTCSPFCHRYMSGSSSTVQLAVAAAAAAAAGLACIMMFSRARGMKHSRALSCTVVWPEKRVMAATTASTPLASATLNWFACTIQADSPRAIEHMCMHTTLQYMMYRNTHVASRKLVDLFTTPVTSSTSGA